MLAVPRLVVLAVAVVVAVAVDLVVTLAVVVELAAAGNVPFGPPVPPKCLPSN